MFDALYTAVSGMDATNTELSVIGNNIANMNTIGFKASTVSFDDVLSQSIANGSGASQIGQGVAISSVSPDFSEGSFESTSNSLDLAINGNGMFMVNKDGADYYTRDGQFSLGSNGNIVDSNGNALQGYLANAAGDITGTIGNLQLTTGQSPANATTVVNLGINLNSMTTGAADNFTLDGNGPHEPNDPANYDFSNTTTIYDAQGSAHNVTEYFVKTGNNTWNVHYVYADPAVSGQLLQAGQTSGGAGADPTGAATVQQLTFNADGSLNTVASVATPVTFNFGGGAAAQTLNFNYGTSTQYAGSNSIANVTQDGYASGSLMSESISNTGVISEVFSNGETRAVGQVALAGFSAPSELTELGGNLYEQSVGSGAPVIGTAGSSGLGNLDSSSLEESNTDLDQEMVQMITAQNGYDANSKIIQTADDMLQALMNIKQS
ncbi:MAG TPA: flagellar hook protein FlgE [Nitrospirota bacterium]|nr:flagellar hook protein FlgE [Nitrospirota bacterium]